MPNVVDVASFGGPTREYQVRVDPDKLISYGLSIGQVEQQLTNNNANAGGSFIEAGLQQINVARSGSGEERPRHRKYGAHDQERHAAAGQGYRRGGAGPEDPAGPIRASAIRREDGKIIDNDDVVSGIVLLRKGADARRHARGDPCESRRAERSHSAARREGGSVSSTAATWCTSPRIPCCTT